MYCKGHDRNLELDFILKLGLLIRCGLWNFKLKLPSIQTMTVGTHFQVSMCPCVLFFNPFFETVIVHFAGKGTYVLLNQIDHVSDFSIV